MKKISGRLVNLNPAVDKINPERKLYFKFSRNSYVILPNVCTCR